MSISTWSQLSDDESILCEPQVAKKRDVKAKEILSYLLAIKTGDTRAVGNVTLREDKLKSRQRKVVDDESRDESSYGVECILTRTMHPDDDSRGSTSSTTTTSSSVLLDLYQTESRHSNISIRGIFPSSTVDSQRGVYPASTSDSQRAQDCILPPTRPRQHKARVPYHEEASSVVAASVPLSPVPDESSVVSRWSNSSRVKPLFDPHPDMASVTSKSTGSGNGTMDAIYEAYHHRPTEKKDVTQDDPWKAAKRGDLKALEKFHANNKKSGGGVNWSAEDQYQHTPLYYACHSGALVDIKVVSFLLQVTPNTPSLLENCRTNAINKQVIQLLEGVKPKLFQTPPSLPQLFKPIAALAPWSSASRGVGVGTTAAAADRHSAGPSEVVLPVTRSEMESIAGFSLSGILGSESKAVDDITASGVGVDDVSTRPIKGSKTAPWLGAGTGPQPPKVRNVSLEVFGKKRKRSPGFLTASRYFLVCGGGTLSRFFPSIRRGGVELPKVMLPRTLKSKNHP
jgi:hypothetical protein